MICSFVRSLECFGSIFRIVGLPLELRSGRFAEKELVRGLELTSDVGGKLSIRAREVFSSTLNSFWPQLLRRNFETNTQTMTRMEKLCRSAFFCFKTSFFQTGLIKTEIFHNRKFLLEVFRLNKTFLTHLDCDYIRTNCFKQSDSKIEAVDFLIKNAWGEIVWSEFIFLNWHPENKFKIEGAALVFQFFVLIFALTQCKY